MRVDWNASAERQDLRALLDAPNTSPGTTSGRFRCCSAAVTDCAVPQPRGQLEPRLQPVARQRGARRLQPDHDRERTRSTGRASATPTRRSGLPAASRFPASARSAGAAGSRPSAPARATPTPLDKTYQLNEKLTWLKGATRVKFGGQFLHYVQQRFYAGNNGLLGLFSYSGAFTGFAFSDFLLDQVGSKGRGSLSDPWTHLHNRVALYVQDDFKVTPALTLNLGMRWAHTQPVVEKDNRQGELRPDDRSGDPGAGRRSREPRALQGLQEGLRAAARRRAWRPSDAVGRARRLRHLPVHGGHGRQPAAAAQPAVLLRVGGSATTRRPARGTLATGFAELKPLDQPSGPGARVGSEPAAAVHPAVERLRRVSAHAVHVGQRRIRRSQRDAPGDAGRGQPAAARRGRSVDVGAAAAAASAVRDGAAHHEHLDDRGARPQRLQRRCR